MKWIRPVLIVSVIFFSHCDSGEEDGWAEATIDPAVSKAPVYRKLDRQQEPYAGLAEHDTAMRRTSDVAYFTGEKINVNDDRYAKVNNCRAYFFLSDTLIINIGGGNGFTTSGFTISYKNRRFYTEPYFGTDAIIEGQAEATYKVVYQKLTLDKPEYRPGDSIYGRIEFRCMETGPGREKVQHFGIGNFRALVKQL